MVRSPTQAGELNDDADLMTAASVANRFSSGIKKNTVMIATAPVDKTRRFISL
jgi:hypothetical protein